jgi:hypothetical protein
MAMIVVTLPGTYLERKLIMEAMLYRDSISGRFLEELSIKISGKKYTGTKL